MTMRDYIVFGEDWGRHPSSTQHLFKHMLGARHIVWCNSIGLRKPDLCVSDMVRAVRKVQAFMGRPEPSHDSAGPRMSVVQPFAIPAPRHAAARAFNRHMLKRQVGRAAQQIGLKDPVLWISLPAAAPLVGAFGDLKTVYYCGDDFSALAGVDHGAVVELEQELLRICDLIFAASPEIASRLPANKTVVLPHGVDLEFFNRPALRPADLPVGRPIAGFYGTLAPWLDLELIEKSAASLPDWWFVFIGPETVDTRRIRALDNVRFLGPRKHSELPAYVHNWDVSLLPFRACAQIEACNPLKLREYLAAGRPIVSTPFPALDPYRDLIFTASTAGDFTQAIRRALHDAGRDSQRQDSVRKETWAMRAAYAERCVEERC